MAARLRRTHLDLAREKIQTSQLLNRLHANAMGELELSKIQQRSIEILLRKVLPDLSQSDINHTVKRDATDFSRAELLAIANAANGSERAVEANGRGGDPDTFH